MSWKYIIVKVGEGVLAREMPIIFPSLMVHSEMSEAVRYYYQREARYHSSWGPVIPVSAGDINFDITTCGGKSESLKLHSRHSDRNVIQMHEYTGGIIG